MQGTERCGKLQGTSYRVQGGVAGYGLQGTGCMEVLQVTSYRGCREERCCRVQVASYRVCKGIHNTPKMFVLYFY